MFCSECGEGYLNSDGKPRCVLHLQASSIAYENIRLRDAVNMAISKFHAHAAAINVSLNDNKFTVDMQKLMDSLQDGNIALNAILIAIDADRK